MFILLGYASLALVQLYREHRRRGQYSTTMLRALRGGSVLVQQAKRAQHGSIGALLNSSLLSCSRSYKEMQLMTDDHLAVSVVSPKQQVDLGEWTSYLHLPPPPSSCDGVVALLEADTPNDLDLKSPPAVPSACQVHVLKHGCPLAWKYGSPFGIILYCSHDDFVLLCDAFGQGRLTLDGDLQLSRMLTVSTVGKPKSLRRPRSEEAVITSPAEQENIVKTKRANTDPIQLLASVSTDSPLYISVAHGDAMNERSSRNVSASPAKLNKEKVDAEEKVNRVATTEQSLEVKGNKEMSSQQEKVGSNTMLNSADQHSMDQENGGVSAGWENSMQLPQSPLLVKTASLEAGLSVQSLSSDTHSAVTDTTPHISLHSQAERETLSEDDTVSNSSLQVQAGTRAPSDGDTISVSSWQELEAPRENGSQLELEIAAQTQTKVNSSMEELHVSKESEAEQKGSQQELQPSTETKLNGSLQELQLPLERGAKLNGSSQELELATETEMVETKLNGSKQELDQTRDTATELTGSQPDVAASVEEDSVLTESQQNLSSLPETCTVSNSSEQELTANTETSAPADGSHQESKPTHGDAPVSGSVLQDSKPSPKHGEKNSVQTSIPTTKESKESTGVSLNGSGQTPKSESASAQPHSSSANEADSGGDKQTSGKPPNIVVYCGKKDSARKFDMIKTALNQCLNKDAYTVYMLPHEDIMTMPWEDNTAVLIISHDYLHDNIGKKCASFLLNGGKVISFGSSLEAEFVIRKEYKARPTVTKFNLGRVRDVFAIQGRYHYVQGGLRTKVNSSMETVVKDPASGSPLVVHVTLSSECGAGEAIFSQLLLEKDPSEMATDSKTFSHLKQSNKERLEVLRHLLSLLQLDTSSSAAHTLTPGYLLAQDQSVKKQFLDSLAGRLKQGAIRSRSLTLKFVTAKSGSSALTATSNTLPVVTDASWESCKGKEREGSLQSFDVDVYWRNLGSSVMGHVVLYTEIIPTTMTVFEGIQFSIPAGVGVIAVAGRQTSGKGRGGNTWLSPAGCAMFTLPLHLPVNSYLGQRVSFLQHIVSLAVVHGVRSIPGYQGLDLRLKWPNDIYYGNRMKLGGVLVTSTVMGDTIHATIGCGVNISNNQPTVCINSVIEEHNRRHGLNLKPLSTSEVLARTVTMLEEIVSQFQDKGHQDFCQLYYKYWLHSGARVKVESEGNTEVEVCGLDDYGFLRVANKQGEHLSLQPDGNSFDMLHNLITIKRE